jgi:hypothetical protein
MSFGPVTCPSVVLWASYLSFFTQRFHPFGAWCSSAPAGTAASHDEPAAEARGGYISDGAFTTHPAQLPKLLRQALTGRDARVRLERFLRAIGLPGGMRRTTSFADETGPGWWLMSVRMTGFQIGTRGRSR